MKRKTKIPVKRKDLFPSAVAAKLPMLGGEDIAAQAGPHQVRGHLWRARGQLKGAVVICPGFTEFCERYSIPAKRLHAAGFDVLLVDWPGQGRSGHLGRDELAVHASDFNLHLDAADALMRVAGFDARRFSVFGHSMGGHLALRLARRHIHEVRRVMVVSPMIAPPVMPVWGVRLLAGAIDMAGFGRFGAPGRKVRPLDEERVFHPDNALTRNRAGYERLFAWFDDAPELRRSGPTTGWVRAAYESCAATTLNDEWMCQLRVPVLALTAGDERIVHKPSTDRMLAMLPKCDHHEYRGARHELLNENDDVVRDLWKRADKFFMAKK